MSVDDAEMFRCAEALGARLREHGLMLSVAESCTGGWLAKAVTDVAGSSAWFDRGFVTYTNEAKQDMLGVTAATLEGHGAVSGAVVEAMARGALAHSRAHWAVAISGVAGPSGGTPEKPVGTVWIAWCRRQGAPQAQCFRFDGDRDGVRRQAVMTALQGLLDGVGHD